MTMIPEAAEISELDLAHLQQRIDLLEIRNEDLLEQAKTTDSSTFLSESISDLRIAIEDIGWSPLGGMAEGVHEIPLTHLKRLSELCRAMATVNPLVKNGILIRTAWIWGDGVKITVNGSTGAGRKRGSKNNDLPPSLKRIIGTTLAQMELERSAAADGTLFFLVDPAKNQVIRLPFWQITGAVTENGDTENILYIKRTWDNSTTDLDTGLTEGANSDAWIPTDTLEGTPKSGEIMNVKVDTTKRIVYIPYNRMTGWRWGIPDVFPCIFWSKAYKEFLENCATLTKAYARFAWKVTSASNRGTGRVASQLAAAPTRDPVTGKANAVGASAVLGAGQDLTAVQRSTSVDFKAGSPLAAMVAAGLGVPLHMMTTDIGDAPAASAESLDEPTVRAMEARQNVMDDCIKRIAKLLKLDVTIVWPDVNPEPLHRLIQAVDMAGRSGTLFADEWRDMLLVAMGPKWVEKYGGAVSPTLEKIAPILKKLVPLSPEEQAAEDARTLAQADKMGQVALKNAPPTPAPGGAPGGKDPKSKQPKQPDPPSRGDHGLRDEGGQSHTSK